MRELGEASKEEHLIILKRLSSMNVQTIWTIGDNFVNPSFSFRNFKDVDAAIEVLQTERPESMTILIKGSNSVHLSHLIPYL